MRPIRKRDAISGTVIRPACLSIGFSSNKSAQTIDDLG
jgi:hypothetical protein